MNELKTENLSCKRGENIVLNNINFSIKSGETLVVKGRNGSGKTTLLRILSNFITSHDGWVSVNDILIEEGHAYDYHGGKKKDFKNEIKKEKENRKSV